MNTQQPELINRRENGDLEVFKVFRTLQGEGPFVGRVAVFVRLTGCVHQCWFCDADYTSIRNLMSVEELAKKINEVGSSNDLIVFTGGEPQRQNLIPIVNRLLQDGRQIQIETNGLVFTPGLPYDKITTICSPKGIIDRDLEPNVTAWKYLCGITCSDPEDGLLAGPTRPRTSKAPIYVQPMDEVNEKKNIANVDFAVEQCYKHGYILSLQTHKIVGVE